MLTFKKRYVDLILSGRKRSTIRLGNLYVKGKYIKAVSSGRVVAVVQVERVVHKKVKDITDEDARLDGFKGLPELFRELRSIYGDFLLDDDVTIITFSLVMANDNGSHRGVHLPSEGEGSKSVYPRLRRGASRQYNRT
jgi:hypothetical protein